jgi:hypothetical protein
MLSGYKRGKAGEGIARSHRVVGGALVAAVAAMWFAGPDWLSATPADSGHAAAAVKYHTQDRRDD